MITPFVGRDKELHRLVNHYEVVIKQLPHKANLILLEGEAGSGKSTLINKFVESTKFISHTSPLVGVASCEIFAKETSFLPFYQLLDSFRTQGGSLSKISNLEKINHTIGNVAPSWLKMLPIVGEAIADTVGAVRNMQEETYKKNSFIPSQQLDVDIYGQFLKIILKLSESRPILIIIDDLQWADEESTRLFTYLGRRLPENNNKIMLVGAYRSYDLTYENKLFQETILDLEKRGQSIRIQLPSFTAEDIAVLFENLYGLSSKEISLDIKQKLIGHTSGNPLFITELLRHFEEDNKTILIDGKWRFASIDDISENLPESLQAALEQRIDHLEKRLRELLTIASIEGDNFTAEVLSKIKNVELTEVLNSLVEDLSRNYRLVRESGEVEIALNNFASLYAFRHGLIRDYIYKSLSPNQKRLLHQQVGDCLENLYGEKKYAAAYQLANHFLVAKDYLKLAKYGLIVAQQEFNKFSPKQALWWSKTVTDAINHIGGNVAMTSEALLIVIQSYVHLGENDDALVEIDKLESISGISDIQLGTTKFLKGEVLTRKGSFEKAIDALREALRIFKNLNEVQFAGWVLRRLGHIFAIIGDFHTAEQYWVEGLETLNSLQDSASVEVKGMLWSEIAEFSVDEGDLRKAENANQNALKCFQEIKSKKGEAIALRNIGGIEYMYGNLAQSEALTRRALDIFHEIEDGINIIWSSDNLARTLIARRSAEEAKKILLDVEPLAIHMNEVGFLPEIYIHLSEIALLENRNNEAIQYALRASQIVASDDQYSGPRSFCAVANAHLASGNLVEADKYMNAATKMVESTTYIYVKSIIDFEHAKFITQKGGSLDKIKKLCQEAKETFSKIDARLDLEKIISFEKTLP